jgi:hypothetical protein
MKPVVNPEGGLVDLVVMSRITDCAFGLGVLFGVVRH